MDAHQHSTTPCTKASASTASKSTRALHRIDQHRHIRFPANGRLVLDPLGAGSILLNTSPLRKS